MSVKTCTAPAMAPGIPPPMPRLPALVKILVRLPLLVVDASLVSLDVDEGNEEDDVVVTFPKDTKDSILPKTGALFSPLSGDASSSRGDGDGVTVAAAAAKFR
eukprot:CAMPEP_0197824950 /NCGR_PEP_ID=MMETSP1437-20131217/2126_1 /TAXON_ID=49252 ORGANISM="Eucampia antarctica, Strain CCMP1452" /NCGR_SAMPLE_ID=MMETSP1437 /ASSEMBLY_ACC=CAM_ASM_001096 /LENGTH=102 /DNA_ID=CAMNT_0043424771 /DNA_START=1000 /DNA_END=1308 /DNA_ORIENTATION=+